LSTTWADLPRSWNLRRANLLLVALHGDGWLPVVGREDLPETVDLGMHALIIGMPGVTRVELQKSCGNFLGLVERLSGLDPA